MLTTTLCMALEASLSKALQYDAKTQALLAKLQGVRFQFQVHKPELNITLLPLSAGVQLLANDQAVADCKIEGSAQDFLAIARADDKTAALMSNQLNISGDTRKFMALQQVFDDLDIDWEAMIADQVGDVVGHTLAEGLRFVGLFLKSTHQANQQSLRNYLREEGELLAHPIELEVFADDVDELRFATDRLDARLRQLNNQFDTHFNTQKTHG